MKRYDEEVTKLDMVKYYIKMTYLLMKHGQRKLKKHGKPYKWSKLIKLIAKGQIRPRWIREGS